MLQNDNKGEMNMKNSKKEVYISPSIELVLLKSKDVITVSLPDETVNDG